MCFGAALAAVAWAEEPRVIDASKYVDPNAPDAGLQRAIDAVPKGGILLLPAGRYVLRRSLILKSDMTLSGVGPETVLTVPAALPCTTLAEDAGPRPFPEKPKPPVVVPLPDPFAKEADTPLPPELTEADRQRAARAAARRRAKEAAERAAWEKDQREKARFVRVADATGFAPGMQVTVRDRSHNAWRETFAVVRAVKGDTLELDRPLRFRYRAANGGQVGNLFPALMAEDQRNITIQFLRIVGPEKPTPFNRFVLSAIHLVRCENLLITRCTVERWHSDGFSVQGGRNARVMENIARNNRGHGFHPGTALQDAFWSGNLAEGNGAFGLYYCWDNRRVITSHNRFLRNGAFGVGRLGDGRDLDCLVYDNLIQENGGAGIHSGSWGDCRRNFIVGNRLINNSTRGPGPAIVLQKTRQTVVARNEIVTRRGNTTQTIGVEELGDGSDENYVLSNTCAGVKTPVLARGKKTVVGDTFPGALPEERLRTLNELLRRDRENWAAWQKERHKLRPPRAAD